MSEFSYNIHKYLTVTTSMIKTKTIIKKNDKVKLFSLVSLKYKLNKSWLINSSYSSAFVIYYKYNFNILLRTSINQIIIKIDCITGTLVFHLILYVSPEIAFL